jgi:NADPH:quinone reductase-like Zn-dependent oxidoreductase
MSGTPTTPTIPATMSSVRLHPPGGIEGLAYERLQTPQPGAGEALVRVLAAAITRDELEWPVDRLPATPSYELSGVVVSLGTEVDGPAIGEHVFALGPFDRDGAAAEYSIVPAESLAPAPRSLTPIEGAAIPLAGLSAWQGLFDHGRLESGQRVLILGAAGGVGSLAVQLAHGRGAHVIGTVSAANVELARELGADDVIDHSSARLEGVAEQVDLVFDTVGGDRLGRSLELVRPGGRLVSVAEEPAEEAAVAREVTAIYFVVEPNGAQLRELARLTDEGGLRPIVDAVFPLSEARQAFERAAGRHGAGKIVLRVADEPL